VTELYFLLSLRLHCKHGCNTLHLYAFFASFLVLSSTFSLLDIFILVNNQPSSSPSLSPSIIMTSSSPAPDIASLSLSSHPPLQRLHDTYDYDGTGTGNLRPQYHFATSPPLPPSQPPFQSLSMNQSPLKNKTSRAALPSVRPLFFFSHR
jgi:hypothetical protein